MSANNAVSGQSPEQGNEHVNGVSTHDNNVESSHPVNDYIEPPAAADPEHQSHVGDRLQATEPNHTGPQDLGNSHTISSSYDGFASFDAMYDALQYASSPTSGSSGLPDLNPGGYPLQYPISGAMYNNHQANKDARISGVVDDREFDDAQNQAALSITSANSTTYFGSQRRTGHCKFFNAVKGFGFILDDSPDDLGGDEVFVHYSAIEAVQTGRGNFKSLLENELLEYTIVQGPKGWQAQNVTGPNGVPCIGSPTSPPHKQLGASPPASILSFRNNSASGASMMGHSLRRFSAISNSACPVSGPLDLANPPMFYPPFGYGTSPIVMGPAILHGVPAGNMDPQLGQMAFSPPTSIMNMSRRRSSAAQGGTSGHDSGYYSAATSPMSTPQHMFPAQPFPFYPINGMAAMPDMSPTTNNLALSPYASPPPLPPHALHHTLQQPETGSGSNGISALDPALPTPSPSSNGTGPGSALGYYPITSSTDLAQPTTARLPLQSPPTTALPAGTLPAHAPATSTPSSPPSSDHPRQAGHPQNLHHLTGTMAAGTVSGVPMPPPPSAPTPYYRSGPGPATGYAYPAMPPMYPPYHQPHPHPYPHPQMMMMVPPLPPTRQQMDMAMGVVSSVSSSTRHEHSNGHSNGSAQSQATQAARPGRRTHGDGVKSDETNITKSCTEASGTEEVPQRLQEGPEDDAAQDEGEDDEDDDVQVVV